MSHDPAPHGPIPTPRQLAWHALQFYGFVHFTVNTFTDKEWGYGDEPESVFNPSALDCRQWARVARDGGMKGLILTAKHHDGFCLWPSPHTRHSVKNSPWRRGAGDVVREFVDACCEYGLKAGLYLSPWDRNHAEYGRPAYVDYYRSQLKELMTQYGPLFEVWFDGANGGDGYYGGARETRKIDQTTYYTFPALWDLVRQHQPDACMFSDAGPDQRWCGNESGFLPVTSWARMRLDGFYPGKLPEADGQDRLGSGDPDGDIWCGAEVDVSIRPGWFWHASEQPRPLEELQAIYQCSVERGANLLLNLAPDTRGLIPDADVARLVELKAFIDRCQAGDIAPQAAVAASSVFGVDSRFAAANLVDGRRDTCWAAAAGVTQSVITLTLAEKRLVDAVRIEEFIELGQRIERFSVSVRTGWGQTSEVAVGTTVGAQRVVRFPPVAATAVRVTIQQAQATPVLRRIGVHAV